MSELVSAARQTFLNMRRIHPEMQQKDGESGHQLRIRQENFVAKRWGCEFNPATGSSSIRHFTSAKYPPYRAPTTRKNTGFFADLREYGAAKFKKDGSVIPSSLGKGPTRDEYIDEFNGYARLRKMEEAKSFRKRVA